MGRAWVRWYRGGDAVVVDRVGSGGGMRSGAGGGTGAEAAADDGGRGDQVDPPAARPPDARDVEPDGTDLLGAGGGEGAGGGVGAERRRRAERDAVYESVGARG